jgi:hypothetical protein
MEAICRPWGKPQVFGEDTPEFAGGGADEFLSGEEEGLSARGCREEKREGYPDKVTSPQESERWIDSCNGMKCF